MNKSILALLFILAACKNNEAVQPAAASGVRKATVKIETGSDGLTVEQRNVKERLVRDNQPGSIKHLYVISNISGQVIMYSTVKGKVTSSSKRLTPNTVIATASAAQQTPDYVGGFAVDVGGHTVRTNEVLSDDGTYGSSIPYLFWFDAQNRYHQHFVSAGEMLHISDQPMAFKSIIINMETMNISQTASELTGVKVETTSAKAPR